jgi:hypothetical protein
MANDTETTDTSVPTNDAYTGMLVVSLLALIAGSLLLFLDYSQYPGNPPALKALPPVQKQEDKKADNQPPQLPGPGNPGNPGEAKKDM